MIAKSTVSFVRSLHQKKQREAQQLFLVEGEKMVEELLASDFLIHSLYATEKWETSSLSATQKDSLTLVSDKVLEQLSVLKTANKVVAVVKQPLQKGINELKQKYYIALDSISDPGNMGTIIRIADWFGINELFYSSDSVELYNPKVVQATMGSIFRVNAIETDLQELLEQNQNEMQLPVIATVLKGKNIYEQQLPSAGILVIGNESRGVSPGLQKYFTHTVSIPSFSTYIKGAESLNAAVATGIVCAELKRQQLK